MLAAAEEVFAAKGVAASTEEIALAAGVGVGTLFRHFPTKEALVAAVLDFRLRRLADEAAALAEAADAGEAFTAYFRRVVAASGTKLALADALTEAGIEAHTAAGGAGPELGAALAILLARAQQAGAIRADIGPADLTALLVGASRAVQHATTGEVRDRTVDIILSGLRPPATHPPAHKRNGRPGSTGR